MLSARIACNDEADCMAARNIVLGIVFDDAATRLAMDGRVGPGLLGKPLRADGLPTGLTPASLTASEASDFYTPDLCEKPNAISPGTR